MWISNHQPGHRTWSWEEICSIHSCEFHCPSVSVHLSFSFMLICAFCQCYDPFFAKLIKGGSPLPQATERTTPPEGQGLVSRWHLCAKEKTAPPPLLWKDMALSQSMWLGERKMGCLSVPSHPWLSTPV